MGYTCPSCGREHDDLPDLGADKPDPWYDIPEKERTTRAELASDTCILDREHYFIRGVILIPVRDGDRPFGFGVWVSQKRENFLTYVAKPDDATIGPFFGWLSTRLSYYEQDTFLIKTMAHFRGKGLRPSIKLEPTDHPLAVAQRDGITLATAWEIVHHADPNI